MVRSPGRIHGVAGCAEVEPLARRGAKRGASPVDRCPQQEFAVCLLGAVGLVAVSAGENEIGACILAGTAGAVSRVRRNPVAGR